MPLIPYPDVPNVSGVPPVLRQAANLQNRIVNAIVPLAADAILISNYLKGPLWGIFTNDTNQPVIVGDSVAAIEFRAEARISDYPVEQGSFASYNKVLTPFAVKLSFTQGGNDDDRQSFLNRVDLAFKSTDLYRVATPELAYRDANVTHYDYRRTARDGATLLTVDVWLEEVRQTASATLSNTKDPSGAGRVNDGTIQATPLAPLSPSTADANFTETGALRLPTPS
jgi:hypothetical protein